MPLGWVFKPLALVSTLALSTLSILSRRYQRARFIYHLTLYLATLATLSVWGVVVSILAPIAGQRLNINYYVARSFYHTCGPLVGIRIEVEGEEHLTNLLTARDGKNQSAVLVGNHQSFLDILYLGRIFPKSASIMAKKELKWSPFLGQYLALSSAVFVNRSNRRDAVKALEQSGNDMKKKGISLWVFPEGTRSSTPHPTLLPFKKGAFHLAVQAQVPVVPVVCENYHRLFDGRTRMESGVLKIKVLPPISTVGLGPDDVTSFSESTRDLMLETLKSISQSGPPSKPVPSSGRSTATADQSSDARQRVMSASSVKEEQVDGDLKSEKKKGQEGSVGEDGTEDEMEGDAVLLKRPIKGE